MPQRQMESPLQGVGKMTFIAKDIKVYSIFLPRKLLSTFNGKKSDLIVSNTPSFELALRSFRVLSDVICDPGMSKRIAKASEENSRKQKVRRGKEIEREMKNILNRIQSTQRTNANNTDASTVRVNTFINGENREISLEELQLRLTELEDEKINIHNNVNETVTIQTFPTSECIRIYGNAETDSNGRMEVKMKGPVCFNLFHEGDKLITVHLVLLGSMYSSIGDISLHSHNDKEQIKQFEHASMVNVYKYYTDMLGLRTLAQNLALAGNVMTSPSLYMFGQEHNQPIRQAIASSQVYTSRDKFLFNEGETVIDGEKFKVVNFNTSGDIYLVSTSSFQGTDTLQRPTCSKFDKAYQAAFKKITIGSDILSSLKDVRMMDEAKDETISTKNNDIVYISSQISVLFEKLVQKDKKYREKLLGKFFSRIMSNDTRSNQSSFLYAVIQHLSIITQKNYVRDSKIRDEIIPRKQPIAKKAKNGIMPTQGIEMEFGGTRKIVYEYVFSAFSSYIRYLESRATADNIPPHGKPLYVSLSIVFNACYRNMENINLNIVLFGVKSAGKSYMLDHICDRRIQATTNKSSKIGSSKALNTEVSQKGFVQLFHEAPNLFLVVPKHASNEVAERQEEIKTTIAEGKSGYTVFTSKDGKRLNTHYLTEAMRLYVLSSNADLIEDYETPILTRFMLVYLADIKFSKGEHEKLDSKLVQYIQATTFSAVWSIDSGLIKPPTYELSKLVISRVIEEYCKELGIGVMDFRKLYRTEIGIDIRVITNAILKVLVYPEGSDQPMVDQFKPSMMLDIEEEMYDTREILEHTMNLAIQDFVQPLSSRIWITNAKACNIVPIGFQQIGNDLKNLTINYVQKYTKINPILWYSDDFEDDELKPLVSGNGDIYNNFIESVVDYLEKIIFKVSSCKKGSFKHISVNTNVKSTLETNDKRAEEVQARIQNFAYANKGAVFEQKTMHDLNYVGYSYDTAAPPYLHVYNQIENKFPLQIVKAFFEKLRNDEKDVLSFEPITDALFKLILSLTHDSKSLRDTLRNSILVGDIRYSIQKHRLITTTSELGKNYIWMNPNVVNIGGSSTFLEVYEHVMSAFKPSDDLVYATKIRLPADHKKLSDERIERLASDEIPPVPSDLIYKPRKLEFNSKKQTPYEFIIKKSEVSPSFIKALELQNITEDNGQFKLNRTVDFDKLAKDQRRILLDLSFEYRREMENDQEDAVPSQEDLPYDQYLNTLHFEYGSGNADEENEEEIEEEIEENEEMQENEEIQENEEMQEMVEGEQNIIE